MIISLPDEHRVNACLIKANQPFTLSIENFKLPPAVKEGQGEYKYILTPEYVWYELGKQDRNEIQDKLNKGGLTEEEVKKANDVLMYRSPTISQLRWIIDLNKCRGFFPQAFWNLTKGNVEIHYANDTDDEFKYEVVSI